MTPLAALIAGIAGAATGAVLCRWLDDRTPSAGPMPSSPEASTDGPAAPRLSAGRVERRPDALNVMAGNCPPYVAMRGASR